MFCSNMSRRGGRPANPTTIVKVVMDDDEIKQECWTFSDLVPQMNTNETAMTWLAKHKLISNSVLCPICKRPCTLNRCRERKLWKCSKHNWTQSVRKESFFENSHLSMATFIWLMYMWSREHIQTEIAHETKVSIPTIIDLCHLIRELLERFLEDHPTELGDDPPEIGGFDSQTGEPKVVEIDITTFFKSNKKKNMKGHCVLGGIERGSGKCFLVPLEHQNKDALEAAIVRWILPGTHIVSDLWAEYLQIDQIQQGIYTHENINYDDTSDSEIQTKNIDRMWLKLKRKLQPNHANNSKVAFQSFLTEFMWRCHFKNIDKFAALIYSIKHVYKV